MGNAVPIIGMAVGGAVGGVVGGLVGSGAAGYVADETKGFAVDAGQKVANVTVDGAKAVGEGAKDLAEGAKGVVDDITPW